GTARYGTLSGSSAAAAVVAGAAALLAEARPDLDAAGLRGALVTSARRDGAGGEPGRVSPAAGQTARGRRAGGREPAGGVGCRAGRGAVGTRSAGARRKDTSGLRERDFAGRLATRRRRPAGAGHGARR